MPKLALIGLVAAVAGSSPQVVARIQTGASPGGAVSGFGAIWVTNDGSGTLVRVDPRTNRVTRRIRLRPGVFSVTRGFGALWTVNYRTQLLTRVNPASGRKRSVRVGGEPGSVVAAFGRVWVTAWASGRLVVVDPRSMRVLNASGSARRPPSLRVANGAIWVGFGRSATSVARVDPRTAAIVRVPVGVQAPRSFVAGTRDLWIQAGDHALVRLDPVEPGRDREALVREHARGGRARSGRHDLDAGQGAERRLPRRSGEGSRRGLVPRGRRRVPGSPRLRLDVGHELRGQRRLALQGKHALARASRRISCARRLRPRRSNGAYRAQDHPARRHRPRDHPRRLRCLGARGRGLRVGLGRAGRRGLDRGHPPRARGRRQLDRHGRSLRVRPLGGGRRPGARRVGPR